MPAWSGATREATLGRDLSGLTKRVLLGRALASHKAEHQLLPKLLALPVFASDQLSSVAYATEEMLLVLVLVGASGLPLLTPLSVGVAALLVVVIASYRQTVRAYPQGGGSYIVARQNLGVLPGPTAAGDHPDLLRAHGGGQCDGRIDPGDLGRAGLAPNKMPMALAFIVLITMANLRGAKEAGRLFAIPTYGFVLAVGLTLAWGAWRCATAGRPHAATADLELEAVSGLTVLLVLRAFSSGATALTGVEAIADGVPAAAVEERGRDLGVPLLEEIRAHTSRGDTRVTVVLPEVVPRRWWQSLLHGQTALYFKRLLLFEPRVVVTSVPLHLQSPETPEPIRR